MTSTENDFIGFRVMFDDAWFSTVVNAQVRLPNLIGKRKQMSDAKHPINQKGSEI